MGNLSAKWSEMLMPANLQDTQRRSPGKSVDAVGGLSQTKLQQTLVIDFKKI